MLEPEFNVADLLRGSVKDDGVQVYSSNEALVEVQCPFSADE